MKFNWKKLLKIAGVGAIGALLHAGKDITVGEGEQSNLVSTVIIAALAAAVNTDDKKKDDGE